MPFVGLYRSCLPTPSASSGQAVSAVVVGDDLKLRESVLIPEEDLGAPDGVVIIRLAIEFEIVEAAALSVDGKGVAVGVGEIISVRAVYAGDQFGGCIEAVVEGQAGHLLRVEDCCYLRIAGFQQRRGCCVDLHLLCRGSD